MGYSDEVLADTPLAYWRLGEAAGDFLDSSGNGRSLAPSGSTETRAAASLLIGDADGSLDLHGSDSEFAWRNINFDTWVDAGLGADGDPFSIECIFQADSVTGIQTLVSRWVTDDSSRQRWTLRLNGSTLEFKLRGLYGDNEGDGSMSGGYMLMTNTLVPGIEIGTTYHVVGTYEGGDGGTCKLFIDAVEQSSGLQGMVNSTNHIFVGLDGSLTQPFDGRIDELAYYGAALSGARVAAHHDAATGIISAQIIAVGIAQETDEPIAVYGPMVIPVGIAQETDRALGSGRSVRLGKATETEEALEIDPIVQTVATPAQVEEQEIALVALPVLRPATGIGFDAGGHMEVPLGIAQEREVTYTVVPGVVGTPSVVVPGTVQTGVWIGPTGASSMSSTLRLDILERTPLQAPTSILVAVTGAIPLRKVFFQIDAVEVSSEVMPDGPGFALFSVPVPEEQGQRGEHVLTVDQAGAVSDSGIFTLQYDPDLLPTNPGPDAPPVEIPESIHPSGVRRWVLQDLMPGGLGSYVMPLNPGEMDNPSFERVLTAVHTTAVNEGQLHVSEGSVRPLEWSFKGYCPTQEMAETLRAYAELRRRFYIHDHRGRVWIVVVTGAEIVPRLQQRNIYDDLTDWVHDYTVNAVIFDRAEFA